MFHCPVTTKKKKSSICVCCGKSRAGQSRKKKIRGGPKSHKPKSKSLSAAETEVFPQKKSSRDFERKKIMTFSSLFSTFLAVVLTTTKNDLDFAGKWVLLLTLFFSLARQQKIATQLPKKEFQKIGLKIGLYCGVGTPP